MANQNKPSSLPNEDVDWSRVRAQHKTGTDPKLAQKHEADIEKLDKRMPEEAGGQGIPRKHRRY
jgi:hypothetical protein